jgi:hypothetical protein
MKFQSYSYSRPDLAVFSADFEALLEKLQKSDDFATQESIFEDLNAMRNEFETMYNISYIRHTIDTKNEFYEKENNFFDENTPQYQAAITKL